MTLTSTIFNHLLKKIVYLFKSNILIHINKVYVDFKSLQ